MVEKVNWLIMEYKKSEKLKAQITEDMAMTIQEYYEIKQPEAL